MLSLIILLSKIVSIISKFLNIGLGSTWPGHIALRLDKNILDKFIRLNKDLKIIVVAGTNGKTTTTSLIKYLLNGLGYRVFSNPEGANLLNGVVSSFIRSANIFGKLDYQYAVIEVDEFSLPKLLNKLEPSAVLILNLFRDQLDRYGEVNTIALKWKESLAKLPKRTAIILNGDDPQLTYIGKTLSQNIHYFGVTTKLMKIKTLPHDVDFIFCPSCLSALDYLSISYSHLGDFQCRKCGFKRGEVEDFAFTKLEYPLSGLYNIYNTNAAVLIIRTVLKGSVLDKDRTYNTLLKTFSASFGRQEELEYKGRKFFVMLSKNPAGFNQSIRTVDSLVNDKANFLILLNDRVPDGRDVSWIWDVDFEPILEKSKQIYISGDRAYDMALRLKYELLRTVLVPKTILKEAVDEVLKVSKKNERIYVLATYSAMLEVRKILIGRKLL